MNDQSEKVKVKEIEVPLFNMFIYVFVDEREKLDKWAKETFDVDIKLLEDLDDAEDSADGLTIDLKNCGLDGNVIVFLKDFYPGMLDYESKPIGVLSHEIIHAVVAVLRSRGIPFNAANEELIAYLHEYIFNKALEYLKGLE